MNSHYFGFKRHMFIITSMILWSCSVDHATSSDSRLTQCAGASSLESCRAVKTSTTNTETNPDTQANNILPLGGSLGTSGSLAGPATWSLQSANIAPDGRVLRLKFSIPKIPADYSMPDWKPGVLAGASIQLSSGATLDYLGSWATYADYPLPMVNNEAAQNVAALSPGLYWMAYTLVDSQGNESKVSPAIRLPIKKDTTYQSDYKAT